MLEVSYESRGLDPEYSKLKAAALEFYEENETQYRLYTSPRTPEEVQVHNTYGGLLRAADEFAEKCNYDVTDVRTTGKGYFLGLINEERCAILTAEEGVKIVDLDTIRQPPIPAPFPFPPTPTKEAA